MIDITYVVGLVGTRCKVTPGIQARLSALFLAEDDDEARRRWALLRQFAEVVDCEQDDPLLVVACGIAMYLHARRMAFRTNVQHVADPELRELFEGLKYARLGEANRAIPGLVNYCAEKIVDELKGSADIRAADNICRLLAEVLSLEGIEEIPSRKAAAKMALVRENLRRIALKQKTRAPSDRELPDLATRKKAEAERKERLAEELRKRREANPVHCCACGTSFVEQSEHSYSPRCVECVAAKHTTPRNGRFCRRCGKSHNAPEDLQRGLGSPYCSDACRESDPTQATE